MACFFFPTTLPLWVVARLLGVFRGRAENTWTEAMRPLGSSTRLPIHTLSICSLPATLSWAEQIDFVKKKKKPSTGGLSVSKVLQWFLIFLRIVSEAQAWPAASSDSHVAFLFSPISLSVPCHSTLKLQQYYVTLNF